MRRSGEEQRRVEATLAEHPRVADVAAVLDEEGLAPSLVAFVVPAGASPPPVEELRARLRSSGVGSLPIRFASLPILPRDAGGDLRRELLSTLAEGAAPRPHSDPIEAGVVAAWEQALEAPAGVKRNFFDGGGNSFRAARAVAAVRATLGVDVPLRAIFDHSNLEDFTDSVRETSRRSPLLRLQDGEGAPLFLVHDVTGDVAYAHDLLGHLPPRRRVYGLQLDAAGSSPATVGEAAHAYAAQVRDVEDAAPYAICGYGRAGIFALELARRLLEDGEPLSLLALVGTQARRARGDDEALAARILARRAVEERAQLARRALYREVATEALLRYLDEAARGERRDGGGPDPVRVLYAVLAHERRPPFEDFSRLPLEEQVDAVASSWQPGASGAAARLRALLGSLRRITSLVAAHEPARYPGPLVLFVPRGADPSAASGWRMLAEAVETIRLPGDHSSLDAATAHFLARELERRVAGPATTVAARASV
jgi:thioesterase domain-containing protein